MKPISFYWKCGQNAHPRISTDMWTRTHVIPVAIFFGDEHILCHCIVNTSSLDYICCGHTKSNYLIAKVTKLFLIVPIWNTLWRDLERTLFWSKVHIFVVLRVCLGTLRVSVMVAMWLWWFFYYTNNPHYTHATPWERRSQPVSPHSLESIEGGGGQLGRWGQSPACAPVGWLQGTPTVFATSRTSISLGPPIGWPNQPCCGRAIREGGLRICVGN